MRRPTDADRLDLMRSTAQRNTGFLARHILGFDYDKDERTGEMRRPGGIYHYGPHEKIVTFLDDPSTRYKHLMCPRGARKTSILTAYIVRRILDNPDIRILICMRTYSEALKTVRAVRTALENNERIKKLWGPQRGKQLWRDEKFTVRGRRNVMLRDPTVMGAGVGTNVTGSHFDVIILDDPIEWEDVKNPEQIQKSIDFLQMCYPLLDPGGVLIECGTPYDESDVHHHCWESPHFASLVIPCGMDIVPDEHGDMTLVGEPTFPHLTEEWLLFQLAEMGPTKFAANYCMECASPEDQMFFPEQFRVDYYQDWMRGLSGYIMTDTATTEQEHGSLSVLALVLLDANDVAYLADLRCGLWTPSEFLVELFDLYSNWQAHCRIQGVVMERIALNHVYRAQIEDERGRRRLAFRIISVPRGVGVGSKKQRILGLQNRFASSKFVVLNTVPGQFRYRGRYRCLFTMEAVDKDGNIVPGGELVDQFVRPNAKRKDIPDALADLEAVDAAGRRLCTPTPPSRWRPKVTDEPVLEFGAEPLKGPPSWTQRHRRRQNPVSALARRTDSGAPRWQQRRRS